ncbi:MAG: hypothetical protein IKT08_05440 [Bacteroidales bacterium]|nr:hypothetical protein [Bacteroidales bacterium]
MGISHPDLRLKAIDTLMWQQPDSAFSQLQAFAESPAMDSLDAFNGHFFHLLLSELLYKNDHAQTNRNALLLAVGYYDSLVVEEGNRVHLNLAFLDARAHYINGVGYYEMDSAVPACVEYLKALEIMEDHFDEKDLVGPKAKFMALVYGHLCVLFTDHYLPVQAVRFAKQAYVYYQKQEALSWQSAWALHKIGMNYDMMDQLDSAAFYYHNASVNLHDTNSLLFRDIAAHQTLVDYKLGSSFDKTVSRLKSLLSQAHTDNEYFARCLVLGAVYHYENEPDSAAVYLKKVFLGDFGVDASKQAAEWLVEIHQDKGESEEARSYAEYLVPFANLSENQGFIKSQMMDEYQEYEQRKKDDHHAVQTRKNHRQAAVIIIVVLLSSALLVALVYHIKTKQLKNERHEYNIKSAALSGRLKQSNEALKKERENGTTISTPLSIHTDTEMKYEEEPICRHILSVCNDERNPIKSNIPLSAYSDIALTPEQQFQLKKAADYHYGQLFNTLKIRYPKLKEKDYLYCYLCLLGLNNAQIAVLLQKAPSTIWEREQRLKEIFNTDGGISVMLHGFLID